MKTSTIVFAEITPIFSKNYNYRVFPRTKTSSIELIDTVNFVVTDLSTLYEDLVQTQIALNHTLTLKHQELTFLVDVSVQPPPPEDPTEEPEIVEPIWVEQLSILDNFSTTINIFSEITMISNYIVEDNIQREIKSGRYVPIIPVEFDQYPDLYDTFIIENSLAPTTSHSISETINADIGEPIVSYIGNIGPMIRLNKQPRLFEEHLSLENCVAILDTSDLVAGELNVIYSFETFVEFGKQYDEIVIVDLALVNSIGFVDAYPHNPLNSLNFDKTTGVISGTINFLDKVSYVIELENESAIVAILNPKLPLPL